MLVASALQVTNWTLVEVRSVRERQNLILDVNKIGFIMNAEGEEQELPPAFVHRQPL